MERKSDYPQQDTGTFPEDRPRKFTVEITISDSGRLDTMASRNGQTTTEYLRAKIAGWLTAFNSDPFTVDNVTEVVKAKSTSEPLPDKTTRRLQEYGAACQEVLYYKTLVESCKGAYDKAPSQASVTASNHAMQELEQAVIRREECLQRFRTLHGFPVESPTPKAE